MYLQNKQNVHFNNIANIFEDATPKKSSTILTIFEIIIKMYGSVMYSHYLDSTVGNVL